jgi:very-short-patch-repair endonuclease
MNENRNLFYNKNLEPRANTLRKSMTKAEACLWKYVLKARNMNGYQFRRQRPVLKYIADFMCKELKLIIEVDGITHHFGDAYSKDKERQRELEEYGFTVLRFKDEDVLKNIEGVRVVIADVADRIKSQQGNVAAENSPPP